MRRINRFGTFLILMGIGSIALFVVSDIARLPDFRFLLWGALALVIGSVIKWLNPTPDNAKTNRFRIFRQKNIEDDQENG